MDITELLNRAGVKSLDELSDADREYLSALQRARNPADRFEAFKQSLERLRAHLTEQLMRAVEEGNDRGALLLTARLRNLTDIVKFVTVQDEYAEALIALMSHYEQDTEASEGDA